jgi:hypothetical protein
MPSSGSSLLTKDAFCKKSGLRSAQNRLRIDLAAGDTTVGPRPIRSIRSMATETGFSHTTIRRIWNVFGLQPHRSETFKLSSDPLFVDKVRDIVGLYLSPPSHG